MSKKLAPAILKLKVLPPISTMLALSNEPVSSVVLVLIPAAGTRPTILMAPPPPKLQPPVCEPVVNSRTQSTQSTRGGFEPSTPAL